MRTITNPETLEKERFQAIESDRIDQQPEFKQWCVLAWHHYRQVLAEADLEMRPYQPEFAAHYCYRRHNIGALSQGGGKTLIAGLQIASIYCEPDRPIPELSSYLPKPRPGQIHIGVPHALAAERWLTDLPLVPALRGKIKYVRSSKDLRRTTAQILIYNQDLVKHKAKGAKTNVKYMKKYLRPALLIIDEAHNLKPGTTRTKTLEELRLTAKRTLVLTGTLSDGDLSALPHLCRFVYQDQFPYKDSSQFSRYFGVNRQIKTDYKKGSQTDTGRYLRHLDVSRLPEYYNLMRRFVHRVTLDDPEVKPFVSYPKPRWETTIVSTTQEQRRLHHQFLQDHLQKLQALSESSEEDTVLRAMHPLIRIANAPAKESEKLRWTKDKIAGENDKVAVFSLTNDGARRLYEYLNTAGLSTVRLYANDEAADPPKMGDEQRMKTKNRFMTDPQVQCLILQINLAAEAIDLQNAGRVIFYDLPWSSLKVQQAVSRVSRPGNPRAEVAVDLVATEGLIDEHQLNLVKRKMQLSNLMFDYDLDFDEPQDTSPTQVIDELLTS